MNRQRFDEIVGKYSQLRIVVLGDFCLDRYLEIDPAKSETSIETGLEVHNVVNVRSQPGAAGTILNNLVALAIGHITPIGFCGEDGEGYELNAALNSKSKVCLDHFLRTPDRRTFTYCKPLVVVPGQPPRELNRLDSKNWSPTPTKVRQALRASFQSVARSTDAIILMDQVDLAETGVITNDLLDAVRAEAAANPELLMIGDSRRSLKDWPPVYLKMNQAELQSLTGRPAAGIDDIMNVAVGLARSRARPVFITLAEQGMVGALANGEWEHVPCLAVRGEIDIVGAGDAVTANLTAALTAGARLREALQFAMAAASVVIHQLGTTGTARLGDLREVLFPT